MPTSSERGQGARLEFDERVGVAGVAAAGSIRFGTW